MVTYAHMCASEKYTYSGMDGSITLKSYAVSFGRSFKNKHNANTHRVELHLSNLLN